MKNSLITVYITNYNYAKYIQKAIESVLNQTYKNIELIIVDDGSTDNSKEVINKYINNKKITRIFQKNKGLNISNNIALKRSKGDFIMRLDADDWLDENCVELLYSNISKDMNIGLSFSDYYLVNINGLVLKQVRRHNFKKVKLLDQPAHGACSLIRKKYLEELGGYSEDFLCQDGYDLWMKFIGKHKISNINLPLFYYRQHEKSLSSNENRILFTRSKIFSKYSKGVKKKFDVSIVIPIRGELIDRNSLAFKKIKNKKLINYTIEASLTSKNIKKIILTSPDINILNYVKKKYSNEKKILYLEREAELGEINVSLDNTFKEALNLLSKKRIKTDALMNLIIEYPFRNSTHIDSAIDVMKIFNVDQVISVTREKEQYYQHNGSSLSPIQQSESLQLEREELFRQTGTVNLLTKKSIENKIRNKKIGHIIVDKMSSLKVDSELDIKMATFLIKNMK